MRWLFVICCLAASASAQDIEEEKSEIATYTLTFPFESEIRRGYAILINDRVRGRLTFLRRFEMGVQDQSLQVSVDPTPEELVITLSRQGWDGHDIAEVKIDRKKVRFFDRSGTANGELDLREDGLIEDELWFRMREKNPLATGPYAILTGIFSLKFGSEALGWNAAVVERSEHTFIRTVPAGDFTVRRFTVAFNTERGSRHHDYLVEAPPPHRLIAWQTTMKSLSGTETVESAELRAYAPLSLNEHRGGRAAGLRKTLDLPAAAP